MAKSLLTKEQQDKIMKLVGDDQNVYDLLVHYGGDMYSQGWREWGLIFGIIGLVYGGYVGFVIGGWYAKRRTLKKLDKTEKRKEES